MAESGSYGDFVIQIQSFELLRRGGWIPRFTLTGSDHSMLCRDRLDQVFPSKEEADEFALRDAVEWIDDRERTARHLVSSS